MASSSASDAPRLNQCMLDSFVTRVPAKDATNEELEQLKKEKDQLEQLRYAIYSNPKTSYHRAMRNEVSCEIQRKDASYHGQKKSELIKRCSQLLIERGYKFARASGSRSRP